MQVRSLLVPLMLIGALACPAFGQQTADQISSEQLKTHIRYLASDELEGRAAGSEGNRKAAEYIADLMERYGLKPVGDNGGYYQQFEFVSTVRLGDGNAATIAEAGPPLQTVTLHADEDFRPFGFSSDTTVTGQLVFAGYGISAPDEKYDDFATLDVAGKIVVELRYGPQGEDPHSPLAKYTSLRNKARYARDKGAAGVIIVTGPADDKEDVLVKLSYDHAFANSGIPAVSMKRAVLVPLLAAQGRQLQAIQDSIRSTKKSIAFAFHGVTVTLTTKVDKVTAQTANIAGMLEGNDPSLRDQVIVVGAHMDHLGYGGPGSGSLQPDTVAVHHGADDNASGTAGLLELARVFSEERTTLKRSILFLSFSAEELGDLGSHYYVTHPLIPLERTVAMINMDMIGRLSNRSLTVSGTGTSPLWNGLLSKYNADSTFALQMTPDGYGPSDHAEFYSKNIPVLFFFTGMHFDYHRPSDEWQKINYAGEQQVVTYVLNIVRDLDHEAERPQFVKVAATAPPSTGDARGFSVTLGIIPDYAGTGPGMRIGDVRPGGPAEKAGMKSGDVILKMAGKKVLNIYDYMGVLGELKAGDRVEVELERDGKPLKVMATMERRR